MADAARLATMGLVLGIAAALGVARLIGHLLSEVGATDPVSYVLAAGLLGGAALLAALLPALRAMRSDPAVVLRQE
jgi:ABC-type antimicrobial peptide transport system permease subunit